MKTTTVFGGVNQKRQEAAIRSGIDITFADGQRMLFSTTLDKDVSTLVSRFLHNEGLHSIDAPTSHGSDMTHHPFETSTDDKTELTHHLPPAPAGHPLHPDQAPRQALHPCRQLRAQRPLPDGRSSEAALAFECPRQSSR